MIFSAAIPEETAVLLIYYLGAATLLLGVGVIVSLLSKLFNKKQ